jgi:hypothetical protein
MLARRATTATIVPMAVRSVVAGALLLAVAMTSACTAEVEPSASASPPAAELTPTSTPSLAATGTQPASG